MATTWSTDILDYIESSNMLLVVLIGGTYSSRVNCTRVIAVGQHSISAPHNPFLSQRQNVRLRGAVRLRRKWRMQAARVELHIDVL
jgi:hypothetical protein